VVNNVYTIADRRRDARARGRSTLNTTFAPDPGGRLDVERPEDTLNTVDEGVMPTLAAARRGYGGSNTDLVDRDAAWSSGPVIRTRRGVSGMRACAVHRER